MDLERQLRAALVPARPGPQVRAAVMARLAAQPGRRGPSRWVLAGAVLALGAAAAMLAMQFLDPEVPVAVADSAPGPVVLPANSDDLPILFDVAPAEPQSATPDTIPPRVTPAITPFTVLVLPLKNHAEDAPRRSAIEGIHAAFVSGLRAVPGLTLVGPDSGEGEGSAPAEYRLTLEGSAIPPEANTRGDFAVRLSAERYGPRGRIARSLFTGLPGEIAPGCTSPASVEIRPGNASCLDQAGVVGGLLATLRMTVFPPDPKLLQGLQAQLVDQSLNADVRMRALLELRSLDRNMSMSSGPDELPAILRDPALVRAAIQLASITPDPAARAQVWYSLRGSRDPELVRPLVAALRNDADDDTRLQALVTLVTDFSSDPQARAELQVAVTGDPDPMLRALASRALGAESEWTAYVLASLKDEGRPPVERVEALFHAYGLPSARGYGSFSSDGRILRRLDDAAMWALAEVLPRAAADSEHYARASLTLVSWLAQMDHPAITTMLLKGLADEGRWLNRGLAVNALNSRINEPGVRAMLETIAEHDTDPRVMSLAREALSGGPASRSADGASDATPVPPRLGIATEYVQPGPGVSGDLVGKLAVVQMGFGSVAERAGMLEADVLLQIAGKPITSGPQLIEVLDTLPRNVDVDVLVSRDGRIVSLKARF